MPYGSLYFGKQGFFFKKAATAGNSRIAFGLNCNAPQNLDNRYISGSGVGASSVANRRAKQRRSTTCTTNCAVPTFK